MEDIPDEKDYTKRANYIRDRWSARVIGIVSGALIPFALLFVPLIHKYLDNDKEISTHSLQSEISNLTLRVEFLERELKACQRLLEERSS